MDFRGSILNAYNAVERVAAAAGADIANLSMMDVQNFAQNVGHFSADFKSQIANAADLAELQSERGIKPIEFAVCWSRIKIGRWAFFTLSDIAIRWRFLRLSISGSNKSLLIWSLPRSVTKTAKNK